MRSENDKKLDECLEKALLGDHESVYQTLKSLPQDDARVVFNLGWHYCNQGHLLKGIQQMDAGRFINCFGMPAISGPIWKDQPLENKTLLFRSEGGAGDQIINFRFAKRFAEMGARVVISCDKGLTPLFSDHGYVCVNHEAVSGVYYDYWVPGMSAISVLGVEYETLEKEPYIRASHPKSLYNPKKRLKVGLKWSGNPQFEHQQFRRFDPELMLSVTDLKATFYSLQKDHDLIDGLPFADLRALMTDWRETANIIADLDLVITSCTAIAHLAGAMGKKVFVIVPVLPYYIWALPENRSVWYKDVTIFRQTKFGEWDDVFEQVKIKLAEVIACTA